MSQTISGRQALVPGFTESEAALRGASVAVVGCGGLGSVVISYLACSGLGSLTLIDDDVVDEGNLHRQTVFCLSDVGQFKAARAASWIESRNRQISVQVVTERVGDTFDWSTLAEHDVVVDCTDNYEARYAVASGAESIGAILVWGSALLGEGQVSVFNTEGGIRFREAFPEVPPSYLAPACSQAGVLGPVCGTIGSIMAGEVLKVIVQTGDVLVGRMLHLDLLAGRFLSVPLGRRSYRNPGARSATDASAADVKSMVASGNEVTFVDVRDLQERLNGTISGDISVPLNSSLRDGIGEIPAGTTTIVYCATGVRSRQAAEFLADSGVDNVRSLSGGFAEWVRQGGVIDGR